jgi:hypothetical protein
MPQKRRICGLVEQALFFLFFRSFFLLSCLPSDHVRTRTKVFNSKLAGGGNPLVQHPTEDWSEAPESPAESEWKSAD